jgi:flagellar protein FliO/FliZ
MAKINSAFIIIFIGLQSAVLSASVSDSVKSAAADTVWQGAKSGGAGDQFYNVFLMTTLLLLLLISGAYVYKRLGGRGKFIGSSKIRVLSRHHLGPKQSIVITAVENKKYILGVTEHSINVIADLGEISDSEASEEEDKVQHRSFGSFLDLIKKDKS